MVVLRAIAVWLVIMVAETVHGVLRGLLLEPIVGDHSARQIGVVIGSLIVLLVARLSIRWIGAKGTAQLLGMGAMWVALTLIFEVVLGRFVLGVPWDRITEDYDLARGGLLPFGLLFMAASPLLAAKLRR
jgi:hypothetical protein